MCDYKKEEIMSRLRKVQWALCLGDFVFVNREQYEIVDSMHHLFIFMTTCFIRKKRKTKIHQISSLLYTKTLNIYSYDAH